MTSVVGFDASEIRRARYTIYANSACCAGWVAINLVGAWLLRAPRLIGLAGAALAMMLSWVVALRDLKQERMLRGVLNYVVSGLLLLLAMGLFVPEMSVLFMFATFIFLAFGLSYANSTASWAIVALTMTVCGTLLLTSSVLRWSSNIDSELLRWVNVTGMTMALGIDAVSFIALRRTLQARNERLALAELRYRVLLENARDAIGILGEDGAILEANRGWEELFAVRRESLLGRSIAEFTVGEAAAPAEHEGIVPLVTIARADGRKIQVELSRTTVDVGNGRFVLAVGRDVSERQLLEEQLRQSQKMEAIGRLAGGVAHDFNNILSVVLSYGELIRDDASPGPVRDGIDEICKAGNRAADLTRQLLMFSRQQVIAPKVLDLNEVLHEMGKLLERILGEDIELVLLHDPSIARIRADPGSIEQVLMNLVVNARDAMPTGGKLTIETATAVLDEEYLAGHVGAQPGAHVMLAVTDNGIGMDKATRARIFEPFFTTKDKTKGTGLGLATVFGIVQQAGGSVWVYSEPGQGTTFKIYLPQTEAAAEPTGPPKSDRPSGGSETVLVVDDDEQVRAAVCRILRSNGYFVIEAGSADEAVRRCHEHSGAIALLLTDVVMPQMSGPELAKRVAEIRPATKVVCMSGYTDESIVRHGALGAEIAYLQKPITTKNLPAKVREVIDSPPGKTASS